MNVEYPTAFYLQKIIVDNCNNCEVTPQESRSGLEQDAIILRLRNLAGLLNVYGGHFNEYYCGKNNKASITFGSLTNGVGHFTCQNTNCPFNNGV